MFPAQASHRRQRRDENAPPRSLTPALPPPVHGSLRRVLRPTNGPLEARVEGPAPAPVVAQPPPAPVYPWASDI
ncbi:hypothetical protein BD309DRAFT_987732 [Dichomitus squalens]|nr:hypothetical protein BD309DRAFT_987732 [Dichomitus squalens]